MPQGRTKQTGTSASKKTTRGKTAEKSSVKPARKKSAPQGNLYFSLDIGTHTVVGVAGELRDDDFHVLDCVSIPHNKRAMIDGQIEDIDEVAKIAAKVKSQVEKDLGVKLSRVAIAAAGRALKTKRVRVDIDIDGRDAITDDMVKSFEIEAIQKAQSELDEENSKEAVSFYCVGHSIVNYFLDDYPIKSFVGHKGKTATVDTLAAFLPSIVVESLYAVTDKLKLEVQSLTLEPIAAMNVIIPPEVRLINIALVDIGAGTSDIAISKGGSIVAYAMATTAGDEITEEIIKKYLVDFNMAEQMKLSSEEEKITYTDILGNEHKIPSAEFFKSLFPAVELLASTIAENIVSANGGEAPSAVFLVGGGSQIEGLAENVAKKLSLPADRVAVGGSKLIKHVTADKPSTIKGPEFVTPIGIGVTATMSQGYDFSTILLNGKKIRVFNKNRITMLDLLSMAGYRSTNLLGRSGRNITYTINGEQKLVKGELSSPAVITVNGLPANINTTVQKGDDITIIPAENGADANIFLKDAVEGFSPIKIKLSGMTYDAGIYAVVNGTPVFDKNYRISNFDDIREVKISTIAQLLKNLDATPEKLVIFKGKRILPPDYKLSDGDEYSVEETEMTPKEKAAEPTVAEDIPAPTAMQEVFQTEEKTEEPENLPEEITDEDIDAVLAELKEEEKPQEAPVQQKGVAVSLNGKTIQLMKPSDSNENIFLELMAFADIDTKNPKGDDIDMLKNGKPASYMDVLKDGDVCSIKWITRRQNT